MRYHISLASSIFVIVGGVAAGQAPQPGPAIRISPIAYSRYQMFNHATLTPIVLEELELTPDQRAQIQKIRSELARANVESRATAKELAAREVGPEVEEAIEKQRRAERQRRGAEAEPALLKLLDRRQRARLDQIRIQASGTSAFLLPDVQEALNLDPGQLERIRAIIAEGFSARRALPETKVAQRIRQEAQRRAGDGEPTYQPGELKALEAEREKRRAQQDRVHDAVSEKIERVLTKRQRAAYHKMLGDPLIVDGRVVRKPGPAGPKDEAKAP